MGKKVSKWTYMPNIFSITAPNLKTLIRPHPNLKIQIYDSHLIATELLKVQKKALPEQYYFCQIFQNFTKVMLLGQGLFLDFQ